MRWLIVFLLFSTAVNSADLLPDNRRSVSNHPLYNQALYYLHSGEYQKALGIYQTIRQSSVKGIGKIIDIHESVARLGLGMTEDARIQYERLLSDKNVKFIPSTARTQAWFFMAKHLYKKGLWRNSLKAIRKVSPEYLSQSLKDEYHFISSTLELFSGDHRKANQHILAIDKSTKWAVYASLNLAISYTQRDVHFNKVEAVFDETLRLAKKLPDENFLVDKINLIAGQFFYSTGKGRSAIKHLKNVGLSGPFTAKALLIYGWALTEQWQYHDALQPWYKLKTQYSPLNQDVQETLIAIPHILEKLNAKVMALGAFDYASLQFDEIYQKLENTAKRLDEGDYIEPLMKKQSVKNWGTFAPVEIFLPKHQDQVYLKEILARGQVNAELLKLRDLNSIKHQLKTKKETLRAFSLMIDDRSKEYMDVKNNNVFITLTDQSKHLKGQYSSIMEKIDHALANKSGVGLATLKEKKIIKNIDEIKSLISHVSKYSNADKYTQRLTRVQGIIKWHLQNQFFERSKKLLAYKKEMSEIINSLNRQMLASQNAIESAPDGFLGFKEKILVLTEEINKKLDRAKNLYTKQKNVISNIVKHDIKARQNRVLGFQLQARLASARLYDETSNKQRLAQEGRL